MEFDYHVRDIKTDKSSTESQSYFTQSYGVNLQSFVVDPRFLTYSAGVGYIATNLHNASTNKTDQVLYNLNLNFFPSMKISWYLTGSKQTQNIQDQLTSTSYDVTNTTYGGSLTIRLRDLLSKGGNNNFNTNNNNSNTNSNSGGGMSIFPWIAPNISLGYTTLERKSESTANPLDETRDNASMSLEFSNRGYSMVIIGRDETYHNNLNNGKYDNQNLSLSLNSKVFSNGDLRITGSATDLKTDNILGYSSEDKRDNFSTLLRFNGKDLRQEYQYTYNSQKTSSLTNTSQVAEATLYKDILPTLTLKGGVNYTDSEYTQSTAAGGTTSQYQYTKGTVLAGVLYHAQYRPDFLGPFGITTNYDFSIGNAKTTNQITGVSDSGSVTENNLFISLDSQGWEQDYIGLSYSYSTTKDRSLVQLDNEFQRVSARVRTMRIPRATLEGIINYTKRDLLSSDPTGGYITGTVSNEQNNGNTTDYSLTFDYRVAYFLGFMAGAQRTDSLTNQVTLSTLQPINKFGQTYDIQYVKLNFNWIFSRRLMYTAEIRDEWRQTTSDTSLSTTTQTKDQTYYVNMNLNYQLRQVLITLTYNYRQDNPEKGDKTTEQNYYIKFIRPF